MNKNDSFGIGANLAMKLMGARLGNLEPHKYYKDTVEGANTIAD